MRPFDDDQDGDNPSGRRRWLSAAVCTLLTLAAVVAGGWYTYNDRRANFAGPLAGDDARIVGLLRDNGAVEARKWLRAVPGRIFWNLTDEQATGLIARLYEIGAVRVFTWGGQMSTLLVIELPSDKGQRTDIFDWQRKRGGSLLVPLSFDVGQRYLMVGL